MKASIVRELEETQQITIPITPFVREYLVRLGAVHRAIRSSIATDIEVAEIVLVDMIRRCKESWPDSFGWIVFKAESKFREASGSFQIFDDLVDYRRSLAKTGTLEAVSRYFVSGEIDPAGKPKTSAEGE